MRVCPRLTSKPDGANGRTEHIRGVDVLRVRDGKVAEKLAEKLAYVKG
jgi:hypothetical protein